MDTALYLVPTRGRPHNAVRLARQWSETTTAGTRLMFCLDDDDPELPAYRALLDDVGMDQKSFGYSVGPRLRLGGTLNNYAPLVAPHYDAVGFMGDDHLPRTLGWDALLLGALCRGGVIYGNDTIQGASLPTAVLLDSRVVRSLGYMVPPGLIHLYMDNFWRDLGQRLGTLRYLPDVVVEHLHPIAGKVAWDARYQEVNAHEVYAADEAHYRQFITSPEWRAAFTQLRDDLA